MKRYLVQSALGLAFALGVSACGGGGDGGNGGGGGGPTGPTTGTVTGSVTSGGAGVAGATVSLTGGGTQTTNASGAYSFTSVATGSRTLTLAAPSGFELDAGQTAAKTVTVSAGQTVRVDWALRQAGPAPLQATVQMEASSFSPTQVRIGVGGRVEWVNAQPVAHTITPNNPSQPGAWASVDVPGQQGFSFTHTFNAAGTFNYNCSIHAGMSGTVVVE